jgi:hypothetical protein
LTSNNISALLVDENDNLWIGTQPALMRGLDPNTTGGLYFYDGENWQVFTRDNSPLPSNTITSLALDAYENLWIGTSQEWLSGDEITQGGIAVYNPVGVVVGIGSEHKALLESYSLLMNYPNPCLCRQAGV